MKAGAGLVAVVSTVHGAGHGAECVLAHLLRAWGGSQSLMVVAPPGSSVVCAAEECNIPVVELPTNRDCIRKNIPAGLRLLSKMRGACVIHAWHARGFELAVILSRFLRCAATGTMHDHPEASFHGKARRCLIKAAANRFEGLVAVSNAVREVCISSGFRSKVRTIHNGLVDVRTGAGIHMATAGSKRIGFLGMYAGWKGFSTVEEWVRRTSDCDWVWHLYGEIAPALRDRAEALKRCWPSRVFLKGHVDPPVIFSEIDVLVHASVEFDPLPTVLLEAARAGVPVLASSAGGAGEIVVPGETGFLFDPHDSGSGFECLKRMLADDSLRNRMGESGRKRYEQVFTAPVMAGKYSQFWGDCLEQKSRMATGVAQ